MKEHPILFNGEMVRAILSGAKTQTRRIIKTEICDDIGQQLRLCKPMIRNKYEYMGYVANDCEISLKPYAQIGDVLWVRETFCTVHHNGIQIRFRADGPPMQTFYPDEEIPDIRWHPSIHMNRKYSRINLEITNVRVEHIMDISNDDAKAEGFEVCPNDNRFTKCGRTMPYLNAFYKLWDSINEKRGYGIETNPWVWVIEFKLLEVKKQRG